MKQSREEIFANISGVRGRPELESRAIQFAILSVLLDIRGQGEQSGCEWQPIETAPKDGTRVILGVAGKGVCFGFYGPKYSTYGVNFGDCWGNGITWNDSFEFELTHWMPLPDPPEAPVVKPKEGGN